jgi:thiamine kinase-like enzyme
MSIPPNIAQVVAEFAILGEIANVQKVGSGHINDTFHLQNTDASQPDYLLQRINHQVFRNVPGLMQNILRVTEHIKTKLPAAEVETGTLTIVKLHDGTLFHKDHDGNYWRIFHFIKDTQSFDLLTNTQQAYEGGKVFGQFQSMLADLDPELLAHTIPGFNDVKYRLDDLEEAFNNNLAGRAADLKDEIRFIAEREDVMCEILKLGDEDKLPWRITHNDTKFNNILFDHKGLAQCVVDLDTVMPGYLAYDFGDAIRTIINTAAEDEVDISIIDLKINLFTAYAKGYFAAAGGILTPVEVDSLMMGVLLLPYLQAVRFLTDYMNGDIYFKIQHPEHNLQRARAQIQLLKKLEENQHTLQQIIFDFAGRRA